MKWFTRINGERQLHKNRKKPNSFISQISKLANYFTKKLKFLRAINYGSILVEFAICIPIFISSTFYVHDVVKFKRYHSQTEFAAQQMVNIIQNISKKRKDKIITQEDLLCAMSLSFLTTQPEKVWFLNINLENLPEIISFPGVMISYVRGIDGKAFVEHQTLQVIDGLSPFGSFSGYNLSRLWGTDWLFGEYVTAKAKLNVNPADIYPTLKIQDGEEKIIIETSIFLMSLTGETLNRKKAFGFFLLNPKFVGDDSLNSLFHSVVIFHPNMGLFSPDYAPRYGWNPDRPIF